MDKVNILIVEDEVIIADNLCDTLEDFGYEVFEPVMSYKEAVEAINENCPDIAILDIQLSGKKTGIDLGIEINKKYDFPFIFLTSNSDSLTLGEAKKVEPFAFLVKPYSKEELYASIELALYNFSKQKEKAIDQENLVVKESLFIKQKQRFIRLNFTDIAFIKSDSVYLDIRMVNGKTYTVRATLNEYIEKLSRIFLRVHRSYIVNLDLLESIDHNSVVVNEQEIPVGKKHREDLLKRVNLG